ncbi:hypothetical protein J4E85_010589 [Alternaria conjuncta]|uniref:uncharacterized protein n=1 Tax=Alternaria conjuncta TaxID=181017 RepID=UPI00221EC411|nr:uncharacterized protein J4E85_010589 [Alternaria conjuncta]KAI4914524.1 hypothetical protein J4E85_010589 [Alternaria conjuncta]
MRFPTLCITALGFIGFAMSQGSETTLTTRPCNNPKYCTTVRTPPARSNAYTSKETTDSTELTRTITAHRRQLTVVESQTRASVHTSKSIKTHKPPKPSKTKTSGDSEILRPSEGFSDSVRPTRVSVTAQRRQALPTTATCTEITEWDSKTYATAISTHIQCGPDKSKPTCSTSYECGCHSSAFTRDDNPDIHFCWPMATSTIFPPDYGGGRSQRWVAKQARATHAPRAASQDLGGRSQRLVARQAVPTSTCSPGHVGSDCSVVVSPPKPTKSCPPGWVGPDCPFASHVPSTPTATATNDIYARQEAEASGNPVYVVTVTHIRRVTARQEAGPTDLVEVMTNTNTKEAGPVHPIVVITVTKAHDIDERQEAGPTDPVYVVTVTNTIATTAHQESEPTDPVYVVTVTDTNAANPHQEAEPTDPVYVVTFTNPLSTTAHQEPEPTDPVYVVTVTDTHAVNARHIPDEISASLPPVVTAADYGCPPGTCGPACRSGHYCNKLFGRVAAGEGGVEDGVSKEPAASEEPVPTRGG